MIISSGDIIPYPIDFVKFSPIIQYHLNPITLFFYLNQQKTPQWWCLNKERGKGGRELGSVAFKKAKYF